MKPILLFSALSFLSVSAIAGSWEAIAITKNGTKVFIDKESILVNVNNPNELMYKSRLETVSDGGGLKKGELIVATETIDCQNANKSLFALVKYNPAGQIIEKTTDTGRAVSVVKVKPNTVYYDVMKYLCPMLPNAQLQDATMSADQAPKVTNVWSFVAQDDHSIVQVDENSIKSNSANKLVAFTSKLKAKDNNSGYLSKDQFFVAKNLADCQKGTVGRLYIAKHDVDGRQISEERYSYNDISYKIADENKLSGNVQQYVCKAILK